MSCTKVRGRVLLKWIRHLRELGDDERSSPERSRINSSARLTHEIP
jgi:hypothetical protein